MGKIIQGRRRRGIPSFQPGDSVRLHPIRPLPKDAPRKTIFFSRNPFASGATPGTWYSPVANVVALFCDECGAGLLVPAAATIEAYQCPDKCGPRMNVRLDGWVK